MIMKKIDNTNTMKANATRGCVYPILKYTLTNISNTFQINQQQQACEADKYENVHQKLTR